MSAIAGIFHRDGRPLDPRALGQMLTALAHRGPDGARAWRQGSVGLGHLMLHTTPESLYEQQPHAGNGGLVIAADARIDNRAALIDTLGMCDRPEGAISDSELILAAYERWGERCPEHLLGDFAFAIWSEREQALFCARDHMGVKPLYLYISARLFAFATEIKALLALDDVPARVNEVYLASRLVGIDEAKVETLYRDIVRLPAASSLLVRRSGQQRRSYWNLDAAYELRLGSDEAYVEAFRDAFGRAVRDRLRSAFPVGAMLSGGLDSSSIACTARDALVERGGGPLHTFSATWPSLAETAPRSDERPYVQAVLARGGFAPHLIAADQVGPLTDVERVIWHTDSIHLGFNLYMDWAIFQAAGAAGVRTVLSGHDGDTTVGYGYEYLAQLLRAGRWPRLLREARALARNTPSGRLTPWYFIRTFALLPSAPRWLRRGWRVVSGGQRPAPPLNITLNPAFARRVDLDARIRAYADDLAQPARSHRAQHRDDVTGSLNVQALEVFDSIAAAFGVSPGYPFCDRRVIELCLALPLHQKLNGGRSRSILRRAMEGSLPPEVQWRVGKSDISANFKRALLADTRALLDEVVLRDTSAIAAYFDIGALRQAYAQYRERPMASDAASQALFLAVTTDRWLRNAGLAARVPAVERRDGLRAAPLAPDHCHVNIERR